MINKNTNSEIESYPGLISGAYLIGLVESFGNTKIIDPHCLPFDIDSVEPTGWYPYDYLIGTIRLTEKLLPDSSSILFWAGVRFMELWYWHGPGKDMIHSGMDWVYANKNGEGYNSVAKGGSPEEIGWTRNLVTNEKEGFALVENVMPLRAEYLRGIYYGGFLLFDDMAFFNTEIYCESIDPKLPHHRTVIKLIFRPKNKKISDELFSDAAIKKHGALSAAEAEEFLWRLKHSNTISKYREKYNRDITKILSDAFNELRETKENLQLANEKLANEAITDPLTGLHNKRFFNQEIENLWHIAKRHGYSFCIMMIDIDHFKIYNDHYGHLAGDLAITTVAECLKTVFKREGDVVARFGGEEFIFAAIDIDEAGIRILALELMNCLDNKKILHAKSKVSKYLTISIGSAIAEGNYQSIEQSIKNADKALYHAKEQGRNRHFHYKI